jgi:hypothetical protein
MSLAGTRSDRRADPAAGAKLQGWRRDSPRLYWRLKKPKPRVYVRAVGKLLLYRVIAAAAVAVAIIVSALVGAVAANLNFPRWSSLLRIQRHPPSLIAPHASKILSGWAASIHGPTIATAISHATAGLAPLVPAFLLLGLILVSIPRAHRWIFSMTLDGGLALGYYQRHLPRLPQSAVTEAITTRSASLSTQLTRHLPTSSIVSAQLPLAVALILSFVLFRNAYVTTLRTVGFIPLRPVNHYRSTFTAVSVTRRLAAAVITAPLLVVDVWIVRNIRMSLPGIHPGTLIIKHGQLSATGWILAIVAATLIICMPRPHGSQWLLTAILEILTLYALLPHVNLIAVPSLLPFSPSSLWALILAYLVVTGFGFDLITGLLDWPC